MQIVFITVRVGKWILVAIYLLQGQASEWAWMLGWYQQQQKGIPIRTYPQPASLKGPGKISAV